MNTPNESDLIETARAGLNRFLDEGMTRWPEDKLRALFGNRSMNDPIVENALENWANDGSIILHKTLNLYIEIIREVQ